MSIEISGRQHPVGDAACRACCWDVAPVACEEEGCGGLVHAEVIDEQWDGADTWWIHEYRCDRCGSTDVPL